MTPKFAHAVDDVFIYVIDLLSRIERNEQPNHKDERSKVRELLERAEVRVDSREEWKLAKYALVAWIDEALTQAEWNARKGWREKTLESSYFKSDNASLQFFVKAREAQEFVNKDSLEVFYICVMVGFRGIYSGPGGGDTAEHHGLDANLDTWIERTAAAIRGKPDRPRITATPQLIDVAAPLEARFQFLGMSLLTFVLAVAAVAVVVIFLLMPPAPKANPTAEVKAALLHPELLIRPGSPFRMVAGRILTGNCGGVLPT
jgi:type VI secretion system protein ImpK